MRIHFYSLLCLLVLTPSASPTFLDDVNEGVWTVFFDFTSEDEFGNAQPHEFNPQKKYKKKPQKDKDGNGPEEPNEAAPPRKQLHKNKEDIRLSDIKGHDELVDKLRRTIRQFKNPSRLQRFGGRHKKGMLLSGPTGTGKTMLAQAIANEMGWSFHQAAGSQFVEIWVGQGAQHVRQLFDKAKREAPSVVFIDEIDAVGAVRRDSPSSDGGAEYRQTLNEFLVQMNSLQDRDDILVVTATNTIEVIDDALKAPHRFEIYNVGLPNKKGRKDILEQYLDRLPVQTVTKDAVAEIVEKTRNFSGAQIESLISNAVQFAEGDEQAESVADDHILKALETARNAMKMGMFGSKEQQASPTSFEDIAGMDEIVQEFKDLLFVLKHPEKLREYGVEAPRGILLAGRPGTGKTLLVRALANEADCPVFYESGSSFDGKWVGEGAKKIRDLFEKARMVSPSIIFIDEVDAISLRGQHQTLNEMLTQMDGFTQDHNVIVIAATNMLHAVDARMRRPGRFSRIMNIELPNSEQRKEILELYIHRLPRVADDSTLPYDKMVLHTKDMCGADLKELVNEAASIGCKDPEAKQVEGHHFAEALKKTLKTKKARI
ncbi:MAG: AAA family ATPase [Candidatus Dependentiae bacterium]|jgi:transitional endoplasmic reticulum ATPase